MNMLILPVVVSEIGIMKGLRADVLELMLHAGFVVKLVLLILMLFSVLSWAIIIVKFRIFRLAEKESKLFLDSFWATRNFSKASMESKRFTHSPIATIFRCGYGDAERIKKEMVVFNPSQGSLGNGVMVGVTEGIATIDRTLKRIMVTELTRLERALTFLATTGNTAPFIGLFGTVWGIMDAFRQIGYLGSTSLAVVAPGISEALIATAAGLFAAIPAVVAYNYFLNKVRMLGSQMESFSAEFLNILEKYFRGM